MRRTVRVAIALGGWCLGVALPAVADGKTDAIRESLIELRFTENLNLTGLALEAEVVGDSAILTGTVKSEGDRALAERLVTETGIRQVDNRLTVEPPPEPKPEKNPALTSEEREERRRASAARAREREARSPPPAVTPAPPPTPEPAGTVPAAAQ
jgi:BON domain